jgi:hypothetical protein
MKNLKMLNDAKKRKKTIKGYGSAAIINVLGTTNRFFMFQWVA